MGSAEDLGTLTECPERDDLCVTFYGWFTGHWKYNYYGTGPWDETTPLVSSWWVRAEISRAEPSRAWASQFSSWNRADFMYFNKKQIFST